MKQEIEAILAEFRQRGGAFVEDEFTITDDGDEIYNPFVDHENAESWLLDKLESICTPS